MIGLDTPGKRAAALRYLDRLEPAADRVLAARIARLREQIKEPA